jgi:hypothetical protein
VTSCVPPGSLAAGRVVARSGPDGKLERLAAPVAQAPAFEVRLGQRRHADLAKRSEYLWLRDQTPRQAEHRRRDRAAGEPGWPMRL